MPEKDSLVWIIAPLEINISILIFILFMRRIIGAKGEGEYHLL